MQLEDKEDQLRGFTEFSFPKVSRRTLDGYNLFFETASFKNVYLASVESTQLNITRGYHHTRPADPIDISDPVRQQLPPVENRAENTPSDFGSGIHPRPSTAYLDLARKSSTGQSLEVGSDSQKLLILDLNGTLLYREFIPRTDSSNAGRPPRKSIHLRPYLRTFTDYLFHPHNQGWLDVMVWSSAQPKNVLHMVQAVFDSHGIADQSSKLRAVWARDTLGLRPEFYANKVQTYKDLEIVWQYLDSPPATSNSYKLALSQALPPAPQGNTSLSIARSPKPEWLAAKFKYGSPQTTGAVQRVIGITRPSPQTPKTGHSARTTLLVDDSSTKACMQPYNHLCVREFGSPGGDDLTLLAVIGVLDELRSQTSVAGWMYHLGLWNRCQTISQPDGEIATEQGKGIHWFEKDEVFGWWATRGKEVAKRMGIGIQH